MKLLPLFLLAAALPALANDYQADAERERIKAISGAQMVKATPQCDDIRRVAMSQIKHQDDSRSTDWQHAVYAYRTVNDLLASSGCTVKSR